MQSRQVFGQILIQFLLKSLYKPKFFRGVDLSTSSVEMGEWNNLPRKFLTILFFNMLFSSILRFKAMKHDDVIHYF